MSVAPTFAPGAACLFGEDLEAYGLDAVGAAIHLGATVRVLERGGPDFRLHPGGQENPQRSSCEGTPLGPPALAPGTPAPHLLSRSVAALIRSGRSFAAGATLELSQDPVLRGSPGAAARGVALLEALERLAAPGELPDAAALARVAHEVGCAEAGLPLPRLPYFCAVYGGLVHLTSAPQAARVVPTRLAEMVVGMAAPDVPAPAPPRAPHAPELAAILERLRGIDPGLDLRTLSLEESYNLVLAAGVEDSDVLWSLLHLRDLTCAALQLLEGGAQALDIARLGELLNEYEVRRGALGSPAPPYTQELRRRCLAAGALGARTGGPGGDHVLLLVEPPAESFAARGRSLQALLAPVRLRGR